MNYQLVTMNLKLLSESIGSNPDDVLEAITGSEISEEDASQIKEHLEKLK